MPKPGVWTKLFILLFLSGLFSASIAVYWAFNHAREALEKETFNHLVSIRDIKQRQIENYFAERLASTRVLANMPVFMEHLKAFHSSPSMNKNSLGEGEDNEEAIQHFFKVSQGTEGKTMFYDFFLIDKRGNVLHTFAKEEDLGTNLVNGKFKNTALARAFSLGLQGEGISDIEFYAPSDENVSAFFAVSIKNEKGEAAGVLASQIFMREIDEIMQERSGLGETGETILIGPDFYLRSDSRFSREKTALRLKIDREAPRQALRGETGTAWLRDYRNILVFNAYAPINIPGLNWAIIAKQDAEEVHALLESLKKQLWAGIGLFAVLMMLVSYFIARRSVAPLISLSGKLLEMAGSGNYGATLPVTSGDEIGSLVESFNKMSVKIKAQTRDLEKELSERIAAQGKLERTNKEMESFIYSVSHDLRTPIITVQGMMDLLARDLGENISPDARTYLSHMGKSILRMDQLLKDLLEVSRVGRVDMEPETVNINDQAEQIAAEMKTMANGRNIEFRVQPGIPLGRVNKKRLYQILLNLAGNAVKFIPESVKNPVIEIGGHISGPGFVECFVKDNGEGIDPNNHEKIFKLFERLHGREIPGTGMGLAFVKKIVESLGGGVRVESEPGKGAAFYFTVPAAKEETI